MADTTKNSLSTALTQFLQLNKNALEIFHRLNEAVSSDKETVNVDLFDDDNNLQRVQIPSFGFLKKEIERLNKNIENLSGVGSNDTAVRLADGTFRKVLSSKIPLAADSITSVATPNEFEYKNNWFFEDFLNPLLYITIDVSGQIPIDSEKIIIKKYLLELNDENKKQFFNQNYKGRSDIDYVKFNQDLIKQTIEFIPDEDFRDLPPREIRFTGSFDVIKIGDQSTNVLIDGTTVKKRRKTYKLNKLTYTDLQSGFPDTLSLKVGDSLVVNNSNKDTRYNIIEIDTSTNTVVLDLIEGFAGIGQGVNILSIYKGVDEQINIQVPINFDKYVVMFFKPVDPDSKIPADVWSPGISFYTNELKLKGSDDSEVSLDVFYRNEVTDFGLFILSIAKDKIPSSVLAIKPNNPIVDAANLQVVQVNNHITDNPAFIELKQLSDNRTKLSSEIKELDTSISKKRSVISTKQYTSQIEKDKDNAELNSLIEKRSSSSKLFSSIVNDIEAKSKSENLIDASPKYRVRGFFPIPESQKSKYTGDQLIIGFEKQYRYISQSGSSNKIENLRFVETDGTEKTGAVSNWITAETVYRQRVLNESTGLFEWEDQVVEDSEQININQIDIPIVPGEGVEIRIRSISEAGYPSNPAKSDWSEIVKIDFPQDSIQPDVTSQIIEENNKELQRVKLQEDLDSKGVSTHISDQFTANEKFFAHNALSIFSGYISTEQKPITLYDKLVELTNKINELDAIVKKVKGEIKVKILDENGNETIVQKDTLNKFFAGYYADIVNNLNIKKGAIVAKTFFITIENAAATPLEIVSRTPGNRALLEFQSGGKFNQVGADPIIQNDSYYVNRGKYDYVPLLYTNPLDPYPSGPQHIFNAPNQSGQLRGQYMYGRYTDVAGTEDFFVDFDVDNTSNIIANISDAEYRLAAGYNIGFTTAGSSPTNDFIWAGNAINNANDLVLLSNVTTQYDNGTDILLHISHPDAVTTAAATLYNNFTITNAKTAKRKAEDANGKRQTGYFFDGTLNRSVKATFEPDDQYTLGRASVGSYLFIAVTDEGQLTVDGNDSLSIKTVEFGNNKAIQIPLVYQFRMTDFGGVGNTGIGFIAGDRTGATKDLTYAKRMGFDIFLLDETKFSFDIEIFAKYRSNKLNLEKVPARDVRLAVENLANNLPGTNPNIGNIG